MFSASNIHYDIAGRTHGLAHGGIGAMQLLARQTGLAKVPQAARLTAIAKRFRRHLADGCCFIKQLWLNYLGLVRRRLDVDSLFFLRNTTGVTPWMEVSDKVGRAYPSR